MKSYSSIYPQIYDFQNLLSAYHNARRCKRYRPEILEFTNTLEENLFQIQNDLIYKTYQPGRYREFYVTDPKLRLILAAPFKDRVVHHALCDIIEPLFDKKFIFDSYACRIGKGTHAGIDRLIYFLRKTQEANGKMYALKCDVFHYFQSINHDILEPLVYETIQDREAQWLFRTILQSTVAPGEPAIGIPVGNLPSQLSANIYLNELDRFIKQELRCKYYVRYMDDFVLLDPDKNKLRLWLADITYFLASRLSLELNHKTAIFPISQGIDFLGYRVWPYRILLRKRCITRMRRGMKYLKNHADILPPSHIRSVVASWYGHANHANTPRLSAWLESEALKNFHIKLQKEVSTNEKNSDCHRDDAGADRNRGR